jgi:DNA-directed RNA polymerase specialized sigma24 family protein
LLPLDGVSEPVAPVAIDVLALDAALNTLGALDSRQAQLVELRVFGGQTVEATAQTLGISPATVKREWRLAKAWLLREADRQGTSRRPS